MPATKKLKSIVAAQRITDRVFRELVSEVIRPGITELQIVDEIKRRAEAHGASGLSFDPIIATGKNGVAPHAKPGRRKLTRGQMLVVDFGVTYGGYCSDMTRTVAIGRPPAEAKKIYEIVLRAQRAAIRQAKAGMHGRELDAVARDIIVRAGYGNYFVHTLGHGIGRKVHQLPRVSPKRAQRLKPGDVITIEPGIYLPGKFGIRIEDMVVLKRGGNENLTRSPKRLLVL